MPCDSSVDINQPHDQADPSVKNNKNESPLEKAKTAEFRHFIESMLE
jgi:hypothetical protein